MAIEWVIFDAMGVIFEESNHISKFLVPFIQERRADISEDTIGDLYLRASRGAITSSQIWEAVGLGEDYPEIETAYVNACVTLDPAFLAVAKTLHTTYSLGMLSNDVSEWSAGIRKKYQLDPLFSAVIISGDVGYRKPAPDIYEVLLQQLQAAPSSCVLIDDRPKNLEPASKLGMRTVWFARDESPHPFRPGRTVESFAELPAILSTL